MAKNEVLVYSKKTGKKHRIPAHWVRHPVLGAGFETTPRQRDADAKAALSAGGSRADHPDEPTPDENVAPAEPAPETAPVQEPDKSEPAAKKTASSTTETPATRGEE